MGGTMKGLAFFSFCPAARGMACARRRGNNERLSFLFILPVASVIFAPNRSQEITQAANLPHLLFAGKKTTESADWQSKLDLQKTGGKHGFQ